MLDVDISVEFVSFGCFPKFKQPKESSFSCVSKKEPQDNVEKLAEIEWK